MSAAGAEWPVGCADSKAAELMRGWTDQGKSGGVGRTEGCQGRIGDEVGFAGSSVTKVVETLVTCGGGD